MKSYDEIDALIRTNPDELDEQEIENYLLVAEVQAALDRDKFLALVALDGLPGEESKV